MFAGLAIESMILNRAAKLPGLPESERPLLGIQIAPPAVAGMSYLTISAGVPDAFVYMLWGYALYQALLAIRLLPWILKQKFTPAYWAFSFGGMSLATLTLKLWAQTHSTGLLIAFIATFLMANALMLWLTVNTLRLLWQGQLFPVPPLAEKT
ncbi:tellurite resistance protein TehA [Comamonadaceae bacterium OS-4]|nr:tellurite resistance protein TehA [Comamonadaceae bacterium OS-4]